MDLEGRNACVTGAASGIGRAIALALAGAGANVVVADIDRAGAEKVLAEIAERGRRALFLPTDVSKRTDVEAMVAGTIGELGSLDVLVNNAGVAVQGPAEEIPLEDWEWIVGINLWAHIWAVRAAIPHMRERGSGHIVHTASAAGLLSTGWAVPYGTTKFAVVGLAENLAMYLDGSGIGVSVICPNIVRTNILQGARTTVQAGDERPQDAIRDAGHAFVQSAGIPAEVVGDKTVEAIRHGRFWILPHPEVLDGVRRKWEDPEGYITQSAPLGRMVSNAFGQTQES